MTDFLTFQSLWMALLWAALIAAIWAAIVYGTAKLVERRHPRIGRFAEVGDVRLHYVERGSGMGVVFLHGNATMLQDFTLSPAFADAARNARAVAFDRPGFGYSTRPRGRSWTPAAQADVIAAAMRQLNTGPAVVIGHSWSTLPAIALARRHPDLVRSLVLLSGYYYPTARFDTALAAIGAVPLLGDILRYTIIPVFSLLNLPLLLAAMFSPAPIPERFRRNFPRLMMVRPWQLRASLGDGALMRSGAASLQTEYASLSLPVFIAAGSADRIVDSSRQSGRLAQEIRGAEFETVGSTGHMIHHTAGDRVTALVRRAIEEVPTTGGKSRMSAL